MNPRKTPRNNSDSSKKSWFECGVLAAGAFAVVPVADDAPSDACVAVAFSDSRNGVEGLCQEIDSLAAEGLGVDTGFCAGKEVV